MHAQPRDWPPGKQADGLPFKGAVSESFAAVSNCDYAARHRGGHQRRALAGSCAEGQEALGAAAGDCCCAIRSQCCLAGHHACVVGMRPSGLLGARGRRRQLSARLRPPLLRLAQRPCYHHSLARRYPCCSARQSKACWGVLVWAQYGSLCPFSGSSQRIVLPNSRWRSSAQNRHQDTLQGQHTGRKASGLAQLLGWWCTASNGTITRVPRGTNWPPRRMSCRV